MRRHRENRDRERQGEWDRCSQRDGEISVLWEEREMCRAQHTICLQVMSAEKVIDTQKP